MRSRSTITLIIGALAVVCAAIALTVFRARRSGAGSDASTTVQKPVSGMTSISAPPAEDQRTGMSEPLLKIIREIPVSAGTNRTGRAVLFGWLDDKLALSLARESMKGTSVPLGRPPSIKRMERETVVRWPASSTFFPSGSTSGPEFVSVWIDNETMKVVRSRDAVLSLGEALQIAKETLHDWDYDRTAPIEADCRSSHVQFTFPKRPFEGIRTGFFAKVVVSLETGSILAIEREAD